MFRLTIAALIALAALGAAYLVSLNDHRSYGDVATTSPQTELSQYTSEEGVSFQYSNNYELSSHQSNLKGQTWDSLVLSLKGANVPEGSEAPPTISVSVLDNLKDLSLDQWVLQDPRSNWKLNHDQGALGSGMVGGEPAMLYTHDGLYQTNAVAVLHGGKVFLFEVGWLTSDDQIRIDFQNLLGTVQFAQ